jgi:hypothetical protein
MAGGEHKAEQANGAGERGRWEGYTSLLFRNSKQWLVLIMNIMGKRQMDLFIS